MIKSKFLYNNEAIGLVCLMAVLEHKKSIELSKALLIFPFLLHNPTLGYLKHRKIRLLSAKQFVSKEVDFFTNFNERFHSFLPLALNTIT